MKQCWPSVADGGPTLFHNWANVSCYMGIVAFWEMKGHLYGSRSKHAIITQFCFNVGLAANTD